MFKIYKNGEYTQVCIDEINASKALDIFNLDCNLQRVKSIKTLNGEVLIETIEHDHTYNYNIYELKQY